MDLKDVYLHVPIFVVYQYYLHSSVFKHSFVALFLCSVHFTLGLHQGPNPCICSVFFFLSGHPHSGIPGQPSSEESWHRLYQPSVQWTVQTQGSDGSKMSSS